MATIVSDHARRAEAALDGEALMERLLDRMQIGAIGEALDGGHLSAVEVLPQDQAGLHRPAIDE